MDPDLIPKAVAKSLENQIYPEVSDCHNPNFVLAG